ncbi:hypothetical protein [Priestia flexa]|uniref:hypothetical protein n=1 Tax=Priestia flexa TaxID=86664 RepID=UPI00077C862C|nr:hypothetical protein [Priestia flexa]MED4587672.1 hypothetical protein [Priestia flexa]
MFKIDEEVLIDTVNEFNKTLMHLEDGFEFMSTFEGYDLGRTKQFMDNKENTIKCAREIVGVLEAYLEEKGYQKTVDTGEFLGEGYEAFYDEDLGNWYNSRLKMIAFRLKQGTSKEDVRACLDIEGDGEEATMYFTTFVR